MPKMFLQMLFPSLFNKELMKAFRWRKLQIEKTEKTLSSSSKGSAEDKRITLNRKRFEVGEVPLTVFKPCGSTGSPFVALEAEFAETKFSFEILFVATVYMFPPIANTDAVVEGISGQSSQELSRVGTWKGKVDEPIHIPRTLSYRAMTIFRLQAWTICYPRIFFAQGDHVL